MIDRRLAAGAIFFALLMGTNDAEAQPKRGERVAVTSCPYAGVSAGCLMIKAPDGAIYNIGGASPRPRVGNRVVRLRGVVADKVSACGEGVVLERIRWVRTRQRCPK